MEVKLQFSFIKYSTALTRNLLDIIKVNLIELSHFFLFYCLFNVAGIRPHQLMEDSMTLSSI